MHVSDHTMQYISGQCCIKYSKFFSAASKLYLDQNFEASLNSNTCPYLECIPHKL